MECLLREGYCVPSAGKVKGSTNLDTDLCHCFLFLFSPLFQHQNASFSLFIDMLYASLFCGPWTHISISIYECWLVRGLVSHTQLTYHHHVEAKWGLLTLFILQCIEDIRSPYLYEFDSKPQFRQTFKLSHQLLEFVCKFLNITLPNTILLIINWPLSLHPS